MMIEEEIKANMNLDVIMSVLKELHTSRTRDFIAIKGMERY